MMLSLAASMPQLLPGPVPLIPAVPVIAAPVNGMSFGPIRPFGSNQLFPPGLGGPPPMGGPAGAGTKKRGGGGGGGGGFLELKFIG